MQNPRLIQVIQCTPIIIALIVLTGGAAYCAYLGTTLRYLPDENEYLILARNLVSQHAFTLDGLTPTAFRAPGYPLLLAVGVWLGLDIPALRWINFVLLAGSVLLLAAIVQRKTASRWAAYIACGLFCCYPVLTYTAGTFYPQTLAGFLLLACVWGLPLTSEEANKSVKPAKLVVSGLALSALVLSVSQAAISAAFILLWLIITQRSLRHAAIVGVMVCCVLSAWTARNYFQMGAFIPTSTNSGFNLLLGNSPFAAPSAGVNVDINTYAQRGLTMGEVEQDQYYSRSAIEFITSHWTMSLNLYLKKLVNHFNFRNQLSTQAEASSINDVVLFIGYYGLLALAFVHCLRTGKRMGRFEGLVLGLYLVDALVSSVFITRIRFRLPFDWLLIAFASIGLWHSLLKLKMRHLRHLPNNQSARIRI